MPLVEEAALETQIAELSTRLEAMRRERIGARLLSVRQRQVLELIRCNFSNKEIAVALGIETRTVKWHVAQLFAVYRVRSRAEL